MPDNDPNSPANGAGSSSSSSSSTTGGESTAHSSVNQEHLADLTRAEKIAREAQKGAYSAGLIAVGLEADFATNLLAAAAQARAHLTTAQAAEAARSGDAGALQQMRELLVGHIQQVQAWARGKFFFALPSRLQVYHVGERLDMNLETLEQFSLDVRTAATNDALPGVTASFLQSYNAARTAIFGPENPAPPAGDDAPDADDEAIGLNAAVKAEVQAVKHAGMQILFLADGVWPHWKEGSAGPRHAFGLAADRPYSPAQPSAPVADPSVG
jgi:hypothetical protein